MQNPPRRPRPRVLTWILALLVAVSMLSAPAHAEEDTWSGSISGRFVGPDGAPVTLTTGVLKRWSGTSLSHRDTSTFGHTGEFTFDGLQAGEYLITVTDRSGEGLREQWHDGTPLGDGYTREWEGVVRIVVPVNGQVEVGDIALSYRPGFRGTVVLPEGVDGADGFPQAWLKDPEATDTEFPGWRFVGLFGRSASGGWWIDPGTTGEFRLRVTGSNIVSQWYGGGDGPDDGPTLTLGPQQQRFGLEIPTIRSGQLSGTVHWSDTRPFTWREVDVLAYQRDGADGEWTAVASERHEVDAGDTIAYHFSDLQPGAYRIGARPLGHVAGPLPELEPVYYPGVSTLAEARDVEVTAQGHLRDVDLAIAFAGRSTLTGAVRVPAGTQASDVDVIVSTTAGTMVARPRPVASVDDPTLLTWEASGLVARAYVVTVSDLAGRLATRHSGGVGSREDATPVTVAEGASADAGTIDLTTERGTVSGTKRSDDGGEVSTALIQTQRWMPAAPGRPAQWMPWMQISAGESFEPTHLEAGRYRFSYWAWGRHLGGWYAGPGQPLGRDVADAVEVVVEDGKNVPLDVVVAVGGTVRGTVTVAEGRSPQAHLVRLYQRSPSGSLWVQVGGSRTPAADGTFEFIGLEAGSYRIGVSGASSTVVAAAHPWASTVATGRDVVVSRGTVTAGADVDLTRVGQPLPGDEPTSTPTVKPTPKPTANPGPKPTPKVVTLVKKPKVTGKAKVGKTLKASKGSFKATDSKAKVRVKFQWQTKKGTKTGNVSKATKSKLKLTKKLRKKQVRVRVTVTAPGHRSYVFTTKWSKKVV